MMRSVIEASYFLVCHVSLLLLQVPTLVDLFCAVLVKLTATALAFMKNPTLSTHTALQVRTTVSLLSHNLGIFACNRSFSF